MCSERSVAYLYFLSNFTVVFFIMQHKLKKQIVLFCRVTFLHIHETLSFLFPVNMLVYRLIDFASCCSECEKFYVCGRLL